MYLSVTNYEAPMQTTKMHYLDLMQPPIQCNGAYAFDHCENRATVCENPTTGGAPYFYLCDTCRAKPYADGRTRAVPASR